LVPGLDLDPHDRKPRSNGDLRAPTAPMRIGAAVLIAAFAIVIGAQDTTFLTQSRVVLTPVTVTDKSGAPVDGLAIEDFELLDDGVPQRITTMDTFGTGVAPLSLTIAVQTAGISTPALAKIRRIGSMIVPLITGERGAVSVMAFDSELHLVQDFTSDVSAVSNAFYNLKPGGDMTARMLDAAVEAMRRLGARPDSRRVLLLISETRDRGSNAKLPDVMREAQKFNVTVYAASYSVYATAFTSKPEDNPSADSTNLLAAITELARMAKTNTVRALASATGGAVESFTRERALEKIVERLGVELHSQYVLGFVPANDAPGLHRIEVRLRDPRGFHVRARAGYIMGEAAGRSQ